MTSARFDMLLRIAMEELATEEMEFCDSIELSPLLISDRTQQKVCRMIRLNNIKATFKTGFNVLKKMAVACMLIITVAFSSAMCIEPVREAFVDAVVTWYEDYVSFYFEAEDVSDGNTTSSLLPTYLPEGWTMEVLEENGAINSYQIFGMQGEYILYSQVLELNDEMWIDNTGNLEELFLDDGTVVYLESDIENNMLYLVWYKYSRGMQLSSINVDRDELLAIANSIK